MKCPVCGADNESGALFCYRCGSSLNPTSAAVGPTVNLDRGAPFDSEATLTSADEEHNARVYDAPTTPTFDTPAPVSTVGGFAPSAPQYVIPAQDQQRGGVYQQPGMVQVQQSNTALVAMILGISSLVLYLVLLCTVFLSPVSAVLGIPAVILGRNARREIRASGGQISGDGMAQAGVILGWINIGLSLLALCGIIGFFALVAAGATSS